MTRPLKNLAELAVIGGGLAGLSAAVHAARLGRLVTLFEGSGLWGGQVATVGHVWGVGIAGEASGQDLAIPLLEQARAARVRVVEIGIADMTLEPGLMLTDEAGGVHRPEAVILASGASLRPLGVAGEAAMLGRGLSQCATCDGMFFRNQHVAVVGGGDAALHEALVLAKTSAKVTMVCRSPLRAKADYVDRIAAKENVDFVWDSEVAELLGGDAGVEGVRLRDVRDGTTRDIAVAGVFPFVGVAPNTGFVPAALRTAGGHVAASADLATAHPRLFAAGAVRAGYGGNAVQAMAEGVGAATAAVGALRAAA